MFFKEEKVRAQKILLKTGRAARAVALFSLLLKAVFMASFVFFVLLLIDFQEVAVLFSSVYTKAALFTLFLLGALCAVLFYAVSTFLRARWFYKNAEYPQYFRDYFKKVSMREIGKAIYLFLFSRVLGILQFAFYFSPFLVAAVLFLQKWKRSGFFPISFYLHLGFLAALLVLGVYFFLVSLQKFEFFLSLLVSHPNMPLLEIVSRGKALAKPLAFSLLQGKLQFTLWGIFSLLLLPFFYVSPYYAQTLGCVQKVVLERHHLANEPPKPVIFMRPSPVNAG